MKRKLLFIVILLLSSAVFADQTSLLWKYFDSDTKIYILGSIHLADNELLPLDEKIYNAWNECGTLVMEVNLNEEMAAIQMLVMQYMAMPDGKTLADLYSKKELLEIEKAVTAVGIPFDMAMPMYPWLIEITVISLEYAKAGLIEAGVDIHFSEMAVQENKEIISLETAEEQFRILADRSLEYQAESLLATIRELPEVGDIIKNLLESYKSGNLAALEELLDESDDDSPESAEFFKKLFTDRNRNWTAKISEFAEAGGTWFIVVGAGHLLGDESVIKMLAEKGYIFSNK